jgi:hypothetical protein
MENWQRSEATPIDATFVEHIEVFVSAPDTQNAVKAAEKLLGPEWKTRVVMVWKEK